MHDIAAFDSVLRAPISPAQKVDRLAQLLRQMRLIVIFDNCEDWLTAQAGGHQIADAAVAGLLAGLITGLDRGSKLVLTSRYAFDPLPAGRLSSALLSISLGELSRGEAVRLMGTLPALWETDYTTRLRVFQAIGGHPFVLNLFAERAARDGVDHVLADVRTVRREAEEVGRLLLQQIVDGLSEGARRLLERASVLRRAAPREALEALAGTHRIGRALDRLMGWGLVTRARFDDELCAEPENRYAMHSLVREHAGEKLEKDDGQRQQALLALADFYADAERLKTFRYGDIQVFNLLEARYYYFEAGHYEPAARIAEDTVEHLSRWGLLDTCETLLQESIRTTDGEQRARALGNLAVTVYQPRGVDVGELTPDDILAERDEEEVASGVQLLNSLANSLAQAVVVALRSDDQTPRQELAGQLGALAGQVPPEQEDLRGLLAVLQGMLQGEDVAAQAEELRGPYRRTYEAVQALAAGEMDEELAEMQALAALAARVVESLQDDDPEHRATLVAQLEELAQQAGQPAPFLAFLAVLQGMLRGEDTTALAGDLVQSFLGVHQQMLSTLSEAVDEEQPDGTTLGQAIEKIVDDAVFVMTRGNSAQRGQLWEALGQLRSQAKGQAELGGLVDFVDAVRWLLEGGQTTEVELEPPFDAAWQKIVEGCRLDNRG